MGELCESLVPRLLLACCVTLSPLWGPLRALGGQNLYRRYKGRRKNCIYSLKKPPVCAQKANGAYLFLLPQAFSEKDACCCLEESKRSLMRSINQRVTFVLKKVEGMRERLKGEAEANIVAITSKGRANSAILLAFPKCVPNAIVIQGLILSFGTGRPLSSSLYAGVTL